MRERELIDRIKMALLLTLCNRTLHEGACREAARAALDKVKVRKQYYGGSRKKRVYAAKNATTFDALLGDDHNRASGG